jgi:L-alanine-DL-glutamate epimerase-like enolase superfamily enzyme
VATYDRITDLPLEIESCEFDGLEFKISEEFVRLTTLIKLQGGGQEGIGEDVTYDALDHIALRDAGPPEGLTGSFTFDSFSKRLDDVELWPTPAEREASVEYRRWAFESAALDLALRQAGTNLAEAVGREPRPVNFVVSMRLGMPGSEEPEKADRVLRMLERYPTTRFKLDPTNNWSRETVDQLVATGAVDSLDFKGLYTGTPVDVETDPELYRMVIEAFPDAWFEDPDVNDETRPLLEPVSEQVTWDAPIHSVADIESRPWRPKVINIKPSRFGPISRLFEAYDWCDANGVGAYGGGQLELGVGRGQIQYLASIFHPDTPNDTAPSAYNELEAPEGLETSPLEPKIESTGFRRKLA